MGILYRLFSSAISLAFSLSSSAALSPLLALPTPPRNFNTSARADSMALTEQQRIGSFSCCCNVFEAANKLADEDGEQLVTKTANRRILSMIRSEQEADEIAIIFLSVSVQCFDESKLC